MESFEHMAEEDRLRAENEFLKMKMMLEKGAEFHGGESKEKLSPQLENLFLSNIMEFERQFEQQKLIKVFNKIGQPDQFKPVAELSDEEIDKAWQDLSDLLQQHGISLDACSPNVSKRELYRFTLEELFDYEISDMDIPGMIQGFIYDEFHPDHVYDNTRSAIDDCVKRILSKRSLDFMFQFKDDDLRLNNHYPLTSQELKWLVNRFKEAYDDFDEPRIYNVECTIDEGTCFVKGKYELNATLSGQQIPLSGDWSVKSQFNQELGFWYQQDIQINGIEF